MGTASAWSNGPGLVSRPSVMHLLPDPASASQLSRPGGLETAGEVHADPRAGWSGLLGHAVQPVALAPAAHNDQVAVAWGYSDAATARSGLDQEPPRCAQAQHGHGADRPFACRPVAVPAGAVAVVPVEVDPQTVVADAVLLSQPDRRLEERGIGRVGEVVVLGSQPGLDDYAVDHPPLALLPGGIRSQLREKFVRVRPGQPARHVLDPGGFVKRDPVDHVIARAASRPSVR